MEVHVAGGYGKAIHAPNEHLWGMEVVIPTLYLVTYDHGYNVVTLGGGYLLQLNELAGGRTERDTLYQFYLRHEHRQSLGYQNGVNHPNRVLVFDTAGITAVFLD